jgi:transcriptional regulator with PAS, ATPase and Fis domain
MLNRVIHTADAKMRKVLEVADSVAASRATVLIHGESGTGKELLARYIHSRSNRASKTFVALNCAAVPEGLLESELFGYERGAFTGADSRKIGKFESAHQSTFLLDEISELPLALQSKILRVLQEGEVDRLGGLKPVKVDVRIVAASNKNLQQLVQAGLFREDLFYRLSVIPIEIPPLRSRPRDVELLSQMFLDQSCEQNGLGERKLLEDAMEKLKSWRWPGNVRELQNVIERSVLLSATTELSAEQIEIEGYVAHSGQRDGLQAGMTVQEAERLLIMKTLEHTLQNRTHAAHLLGISIRTLRNKLNEYKLEKDHEPRSVW